MKHVLWDWNGTLLDDTRAAFDTLNVMLARRGGPPISFDFYRAHFRFPVKPFYREIGVCLENEDWDALAREYHALYAQQAKALNAQTLAALDCVRARGLGQSVLSALRQDLLEAALAEYGLTGRFDHVYGTDNLDGASKLDRARELVAALGVPRKEIVMIGDSLHDKEVADDLGVACVLCAQGSHAGWRLAEVAPTGATLLESVRKATTEGKL